MKQAMENMMNDPQRRSSDSEDNGSDGPMIDLDQSMLDGAGGGGQDSRQQVSILHARMHSCTRTFDY
jgi:hypothetical protein